MKTRAVALRCTDRILYLVLTILVILVLLLGEEMVAVVVAFRVVSFRSSSSQKKSVASSYVYRPTQFFHSSTVSSYLDHGSTWSSGNTGSEANNREYTKTDTEWMTQQQKIAAPLVDSTLLRFVANNARQIDDCCTQPPASSAATSLENTLVAVKNDTYSLSQCFPTTSTASSSPVNGRRKEECNNKEIVLPLEVEANTNNNNFEKVLVPPLETSGATKSTILPQQPQDDENVPFDTFEKEVVTILLNSGAQENEAVTAGQSLRQYSEEKYRRESIRKFLRNRDALWNNNKYHQDNSTMEDFDSSNSISSKWCSNDNVQAVVNMLLNAGLSGKDCASVFTHTPSAAFRRVVDRERNDDPSEATNESLEVTLNRVVNVVLCGLLQLRRYDARKVIRACPGLLTVKGSLNAFQVVELLSKLGVSHTSLARDKSAIPVLLSRPPSLMFRLVALLSSDLIRMPVSRIGPFLRRSNCSSELLDAVVPVATITSKAKLSDGYNHPGTDSVAIRKSIDTAYEEIETICKYLKEYVGVEDITKVIVAYPGVLLLNRTSLYPLLDYLYDVDGVGLDKESVAKMIQTFPLLLSTKNVDKMRQTVQYLNNSLEVSIESLRKIVRAFPSILLLDLEANMLPVVDFLRNTCGVVNIGRFVTRFPPVLGYSVEEDLLPKWQFLSKVCDFGYFEVVRFPAYFSYPLDKVTVPRYDYLKAKSIPFELVTIDEVLRYGDADFARIVVGDQDGGALFSRFLEDRRKRMKGAKPLLLEGKCIRTVPQFRDKLR